MRWIWLAAAVLVAVAAGATWFAFQRPDFVAGLAAVAATAAFKALKPDLKRYWAKHTPEEWRKIREEQARQNRGDK